MRIAIYEDNKNDEMQLIEYLHRFFAAKDIQYDICVCNTSLELEKYVNDTDIFFLDIEGVDENGIELGIKIRKDNSDAKIIFVSNYSKYLIDGYKAAASRYFLKPVSWDIFEIEFENVIREHLLNHAGFVDEKIASHKIYYKDISYVEYKERKSYMMIASGKVIETNYTLKYWLDKLRDYSFSQPHKSFIVNLHQVKRMDSNELLLVSGECIPLSRMYKNQFKNDFMNSLKRRI